MSDSTNTAPYSVLAKLYDELMATVDYELWADFIDEVIQNHHFSSNHLLEIACGTGSLTFELEQLGYHITGGDKSSEMVEQANLKAHQLDSNIQFNQLDFLDLNTTERYDVVISVFDSINYLLTEEHLLQMFTQVKRVMTDDAIFVFDFTTPQNSIDSIAYLNSREGTIDNQYQYQCKSWYDEEQQIHYNSFDIKKYGFDGQTVIDQFTEKHRQRAYSLNKMRNVIAKTDFTIIAEYGEFDMQPANETSLRITMVIK